MLKSVVIGCGKISVMHCVSIKKQNNAYLAAVCDVKEDRAKKAAEEYETKYYLDWKEMLDEEKPDVVHICTPHYLHPEMAIYALQKGINVLTEKPMAIHYEDALKMAEASKKSGKSLVVSFQNRFNPGSLLIKNTLDRGRLGKIISARKKEN